MLQKYWHKVQHYKDTDSIFSCSGNINCRCFPFPTRKPHQSNPIMRGVNGLCMHTKPNNPTRQLINSRFCLEASASSLRRPSKQKTSYSSRFLKFLQSLAAFEYSDEYSAAKWKTEWSKDRNEKTSSYNQLGLMPRISSIVSY